MRIIESAKNKQKPKKKESYCGCNAKTAQYNPEGGGYGDSGNYDRGRALTDDLTKMDYETEDNAMEPEFGMGIDLVGIYTKENYLAYVVTLEEYKKAGSSFWIDYLGEEYDPSSMKIVFLKDVSEDDAPNLLTQGTSKQIFRDGYEAAQVAAPYIEQSLLEASKKLYFNLTKMAKNESICNIDDCELNHCKICGKHIPYGHNYCRDCTELEEENEDRKSSSYFDLTKIADEDADADAVKVPKPADYRRGKGYGFGGAPRDLNKPQHVRSKLPPKNPSNKGVGLGGAPRPSEDADKNKNKNKNKKKLPPWLKYKKKSSYYFDITKTSQYDDDFGGDDYQEQEPYENDLQDFSDQEAWEDSQADMRDLQGDNDTDHENEDSSYTIEPDRDGEGFVVKKHDIYPQGSVLEGRGRDSSIDFGDTIEELIDKYPDAEILDNPSINRTTYEDAMRMPKTEGFDEADAGERWEQEEEPRSDYENDTPLGQEYGDGFESDLD